MKLYLVLSGLLCIILINMTPVSAVSITFTDPTPKTGTLTADTFISINTQVSGKNYKNFTYTLYDSHLKYIKSSIRWPIMKQAYQYSCFLKNNGDVICVGFNDYAQANNLTNVKDIIEVAPGRWHKCWLDTNKNVYCQGSGVALDVISKATANRTFGDVLYLSSGERNNCVLTKQGNVECWGLNNYGQCNNYSQGDAIALAAGITYPECAVTSKGNVYCWGLNNYGQCRNYSGGDAIDVAVGTSQVCVLLNNGNVIAWGRNQFGQLQNYSGGDAIGVSAGEDHCCALTKNGNVCCWGRTSGVDDREHGVSRSYLKGDAVAISSGTFHNCVITQSGNAECWGQNQGGNTANYSGGDIKVTPIYNFMNLKNGIYFIQATACDTKGACSSTEMREIYINSNTIRPQRIIEALSRIIFNRLS